MAVRKRVWLNSPDHNYNDKKRSLIHENNYEDLVLYEEDNIHFNYGNDIDTSCISICPYEFITPNYVLILNNNRIESRWFILSKTFISGEPTEANSKYHITLRRDIIVDKADKLKYAYAKIKRAHLLDEYSILKLNPEPIVVNQVKIGEIDIKDQYGDVQWATIYYDSNYDPSNQQQTNARTLTLTPANSVPYSFTIAQLKNDLFWGGRINVTERTIRTTQSTYIKRPKYWYFWVRVRTKMIVGSSANADYEITITPTYESNNATPTKYSLNVKCKKDSIAIGSSNKSGEVHLMIANALDSGGRSEVDNLFGEGGGNYNYNKEAVNAFNKYNGKYIQMDPVSTISQALCKWESNNTIYLETLDISTFVEKIEPIGTGIYFELLGITQDDNSGKVNVAYNIESIFLSADPSYTETHLILPAKVTLNDTNCGVVCIPFGNININGATLGEENIIKLLTSGVTDAGTNIFFDVQILPYCPIKYLDKCFNLEKKEIDIFKLTTEEIGKNLVYIWSGAGAIYYGFVVHSSNISNIISISNDFLKPTQNIKRRTITDMVRFVAPNHSSIFEMTPTKNFGIDEINIDMTIKPINPYLRIYPTRNYGSLYGGEFNDYVGLFINGGFSVSQVTSMWRNNQMQISMNQQIFDRQIQSQEFSNSQSLIQQQMNASFSYNQQQRGIQHAQTKAMITGGINIASGIATSNPVQVINGSLGIGMSAFDTSHNQKQTQESLRNSQANIGINSSIMAQSVSAQQDIFRMNNQSMMMQPMTLSKSSDFNISNRGKAYIELISCTTNEEEFIDEFIKYKGESIDRFGYFSEYIISDDCYLEGTIIFLPNETPEITNAINEELNNGIYVKGGLLK